MTREKKDMPEHEAQREEHAGCCGGEHAEGCGSESDNELDALRAERDDLDSKYRRTLADFQNYQRRSLQNEREARERGMEAVVESVILSLDHFEKALSHDVSKMTAEQLVKGVQLIHDELVKALARHGAGIIEPSVNEEFDPMRHQAVAQRASDGVDPGHVVQSLQRGYTLGERVIRPAMVVVAPNEGA